jgi:hypothetical protein
MRGRKIPLSRPRRFVCDLLHITRNVPTIPVQRTFSLQKLVAAREALTDRPGWTALFTLGYARVAATVPALRRCYLSFPYARLVEYPQSMAAIAFERDYQGEPGVFVARIRAPECFSIRNLQAVIHRLQTAPIRSVKDFRRTLRIAALPGPLRRLLWRIALQWPRQRARFFGTFSVSVYSALGAESLHPLSPSTTSLTYGVIDSAGRVPVRIIYDHRVLDGATVARVLKQLEDELTGPIAAELGTLATASAQPRAA